MKRGLNRVEVVVLLAIVAIPALMLWWEWSLWAECRSDHSFWYCMRVLGK